MDVKLKNPIVFVSTFFFCIILLFSWGSVVYATVYYVDATDGDDDNAGTSTDLAWQTIPKINAESFNAGDQILFQRGETWRGDTLQPSSSGTEGNPIIFGDYGSGAIPIINAVGLITGSWTASSSEYYTALATTTEVVWSDTVLLTEGSGIGSLNVQEWYYDTTSTRLYVRLTSDSDPSGHTIEWAAQDATYGNSGTSIKITKNYITVQNLQASPKWNGLRAYGILVTGGFNSNYIEGVVIDSCTVTTDKTADDTFLTGIIVGNAPTTTISNNTISNASYGINFVINGEFDGYYSLIEGNTISDINVNTSITEWDGIKIQEADWKGLTIRNNDISGFEEDGVDILVASNVIVENNYIHDSTNIRGSGNQTGVKSGRHNIVMRYNHIKNIIAGATNQQGIIANGDNAQVYNNIVYNVGYYGIQSNDQNQASVESSFIANNTILSTSDASIRIGNTVIAGQLNNNITDGVDDVEVWGADTTTIAGGYNLLKNDAAITFLSSATSDLYSGSANDLYSTDPLLVGAASANYSPQVTSPLIDAGTGVGLTSDYFGNSIYGVPDIGAIEYQPPFTMGTNDVPTTGEIRVYSDGKYRMKVASSTLVTANFNITPLDGNYYSTTTQYMDITIDSWLTSGTYNKQWTATSTNGSFLTQATSTTHTVGDLLVNTYYQFKIDGTASSTAVSGSSCNSNGACLSDSSGLVSFTYSGGYSTHIFAVEKDVTSPSAFSLTSPSDGNKTGDQKPTLSWNVSSDLESGIEKYQLYIDGSLDTDNISGTSVTPTSSLSCGGHTWYVKVVDNNDNVTNSDTFNLTVACGGGFYPRTFDSLKIPSEENTCILQKGEAFKHANSSAIYYVTKDCKKRAFTNSKVFFTYFTSWSDVIVVPKTILDTVSDDSLGFMPWGPKYDPKYGALVKIVTDPKTYLLLGTEKYWITDEVVFEALGYSWNWIEDIDKALLDKYTTGSEINYTDRHPNFTLVKYANDPRVYRLEDSKKRHVKNEEAFERLKYRWDRIVEIGDDETYEDGEELE